LHNFAGIARGIQTKSLQIALFLKGKVMKR